MADLIDHKTIAPCLLRSRATAKQKEIKYTHQQLDYERYKHAFEEGVLISKIAKAYGSSEAEISGLAADPDHGGKVTISSILETMVALELEDDGILGITLQRGPKKTDLVDGWHRKWDVKTPPYINNIGFNTEDAIDSITRKFEEFAEGAVGILLCISFMRMSDYQDLQSKLVCYLNQDQKFHVRQVSVRGVL